MDRPKVAILTTVFPPMGGGGVFRMGKLAKYLPGLGWDVTVVRGDGTFWDVVDPALVDEFHRRSTSGRSARRFGRPGSGRGATRHATR